MTDTLLPPLFRNLPENARPLHESPVLTVLKATQSHRSSEAVQAIVSLATVWPFDPNATVSNLPLLMHVIREASEHGRNSIQGRRLPRNLDDLGVVGVDAEGHPASVDDEWLAGLILAAGADPWARHQVYGSLDAPALDALELCLSKNMPSLVEALLDHPGAPNAAELAARPALIARGASSPGASWWTHLCTRGSAGTLEVLARRGADPHQTASDGTHPLEGAQADVVALYAAKAWLPTDESTRGRLRKAWKERAKSGVLTLDHLNTMTGHLEGQAGALQAKVQATVEKLVTLPWRSGMNRIRDSVGVTEVAEKVYVARGAYRGTWSGLTAAAFATMRTGSSWAAFSWSNDGPLAGSWKNGLYRRPDWAMGDDGRRLLQKSMAFEWREGVPAKAIVMMALLKNNTSGPDHETEMARDLGIEDFDRELQSMLAGMAAFTGVVAGKNGSATEIMAERWKLIERHLGSPSTWAHDGWQRAQQVVEHLFGDARAAPSPVAHKWAEHLSSLALPETADSKETVAHGLVCLHALWGLTHVKTPERLMVLIERLMAHPVLAHPALRAHWQEQARPWLDNPGPERHPALDAALEHLKLSIHLDDGPASKSTRMRL